MPKRMRWALAAALCLTPLYLALISATPLADWLLSTREYQLPVLRHGLWTRLPLAALTCGLAAATVLLLARRAPQVGRPAPGRTALVLLLVGLALQLGPAAAHRLGYEELPVRVLHPDHTSYFTDAAKISELGPWLDGFNTRLPELGTHTRTHPPGAVVFFYGFIAGARAFPATAEALYDLFFAGSALPLDRAGLPPATMGAGVAASLLLLLVAAAALPLAYGLARVFLDERRAILAAGLFGVMPAFAQKTPVLDHLLGACVLGSALLVLAALRTKRIWLVPLGGSVAGVGLWLGTSVLAAMPLALLMLAAGIYHLRRPEAELRVHLGLFGSLAALYLGGAGAALLLVGALLDQNFLEVYRAVMEQGWHFNNELSGRFHAWMWVAWDPYELGIFAGLPVSLLALVAFADGIRSAARRDRDRLRPWLLALALFLLALVLSGRVVYEASRLCWFAFPLLAMAAASGLPDPETRSGAWAAGLVVGLTILSTLVFRMLF